MGAERHVRIFKNGRSRAIRIPKEFDFPGDEAIIRKEGERIVIEPIEDRVAKLRALLARWRSEGPIDDDDNPFDFDDPFPEPVEL